MGESRLADIALGVFVVLVFIFLVTTADGQDCMPDPSGIWQKPMVVDGQSGNWIRADMGDCIYKDLQALTAYKIAFADCERKGEASDAEIKTLRDAVKDRNEQLGLLELDLQSASDELAKGDPWYTHPVLMFSMGVVAASLVGVVAITAGGSK